MSKSLGQHHRARDRSSSSMVRIFCVFGWPRRTIPTDQRIGPEILKGVADSYRRLRNTMRFMLGSLRRVLRKPIALRTCGYAGTGALGAASSGGVGPAGAYWLCGAMTSTGVFSQAVFNFATVDLSAFYFDIRKDALYCDGDTDCVVKAARTVLDILFHRLTSLAGSGPGLHHGRGLAGALSR